MRVTWVTDAGVRVPVVAAVAVVRTDVGVARVVHVAAVLHADLQALSHVHVGYVVGRLSHTHALMDSTRVLKVAKERKKKNQRTNRTVNKHTDLYAANESFPDMVSLTGQTSDVESFQLQTWQVVTNLHRFLNKKNKQN